MVKTLVLVLLVIPLLLVGACTTSLVPVPPPNLDGVEEALGYSLAPTHLPEGFEFDQYQLLGFTESIVSPMLVPFASVMYKRYKDYAYHNVFIQYPLSFPPSVSEDFLLESLGLEWQRPEDAVTEVKVNGEMAYLVRGSWSAESLQKLGNPDPEFLATYTPSWDYEMYFSLYFDFELSPDETVGVMVMALLYPSEWITAIELVKIAESLRRID